MTSPWPARILTVLVAVPFVASAAMKLTLAQAAVEGFSKMGIPVGSLIPLGIVELTCLILYLIPSTVMLGTMLLTGYLGGAVLANLIGGTDFIHALVIGLLVWAGAWFRVPEFRTLIPIRKS